MSPFTRREVLQAGAALALVGCAKDAPTDVPPADAAPGDDSAVPPPDGTGPGPDATPQCDEVETPEDILGPYYKPGAPEKQNLVPDGAPGIRLHVSGKVMMHGSCELLPGTLLDIWQANDAGAYDAVNFDFRGTTHADAEGNYSFDTVIPGHYLNGAQYRPAHIHVKVSIPGTVPLTTQLYFEGDPYNDIDPWFNPLTMLSPTDAAGGGKQAVFDFVLVPA